MSYFPGDIPFMSKEELRENGIRIPKDVPDTNVGDTISRQAAIDALDCINGVEEVLRSLPPAQPRPCDYVKACMEVSMNKEISAYYYPQALEEFKKYGYVLVDMRRKNK